MKKLFGGTWKIVLLISGLLIVSFAIALYGSDFYSAGKMAVQNKFDKANNEFALKIQELQLDIKNKEEENVSLISQVNSYSNQINNLNDEKSSLQSQVELLIIERDNAIEQGSESQETINNLNMQIQTLNLEIEEKDTEISEYNAQIIELNATISQNSTLVESLNSRVLRLTQIVSKTATEIHAEDLDGITSIGEYSFYNCDVLVSVELPETVKLLQSLNALAPIYLTVSGSSTLTKTSQL